MADSTQTLQAALEHAALVGSFVPARLLRSVAPQPDANAFAALGEYCQEVPVGPRVEWMLRPDRRREVLLALKEQGRLAEVAARVAPSADDAFGQFLAGAVLGETWDTARLSRPELGAMHSAMQFASTVVDSAESADRVQRQLARRDADEALDLVLPTRLVGRDVELQRLVAFASQPAAGQPARPMYVTGFGGSGKSALLAEFTRVMRGPAWSGTPVITLDFDRPSIGSADGVEMILEFSRQLGLHRADLSVSLAVFRRVTGELTQYEPERKGGSYESTASIESRVWSVWREMLGSALPLMQPVVVILDTFEEVSVRGEEDAAYVLRWLAILGSEGGIANLCPIVSGRAVPQAEREDAQSRHIPLGDLDPGASGELLKLLAARSRREVSDPLCDRIVRRVGGNALMLRIISDFIGQEGEGAVEDLLKADASSSGGNVLTQAYLYGRILRRIRTDDQDIVKIAHPGLALRRVTADLIRQVLAPTCDLGSISQERAQELFRKLTRQVWLVEPTANAQVVRHRRHVRTQMMRAISAVDSDSMRKVHEAALAFYRDGHERFADRDEARLEACYHSLFTLGPEAPSQGEVKSFVAGLEREIECIPLPGRAVLKFAASMALSPDETASLSESQRVHYTQQRVTKQLSRGHVWQAAQSVAEAASLGSATATVMPAMTVHATDLPSAFATKYALGDVRGAADLAGPLLDHYFNSLGQGQDPTFSRREAYFSETPFWHAAMLLPEELRGDYVLRCAELLLLSSPNKAGFESAPRLSLMAALLDDRAFEGDGAQPGPIDHVDDLRRFNLLTRRAGTVVCRASLLQHLGRPFLALAAGQARDHALRMFGVDKATVAECSRALSTNHPLSPAAERSLSGQAKVQTRAGIALQPWELDLLLGLMPELYAPLRALLRQLPEGVLESFVALCQDFPTWPQAMRDTPFLSRLRNDRSRAEADLISTADRLGGLLPFAEYCAASAIDRTPFQDFLEVAQRYRAALRRRHMSHPALQKGKRHADPT